MALKKGDIIDERKRYPDSCGLVVKIVGGGEGFEKIVCCGHELTEEDVVTEIGSPLGRKKGMLPPGVVIDERRAYPHSCGLRVMVFDGGAGLKEIRCCGHALGVNAVNDLRFGQMRGAASDSGGASGTA